MPRLVGLDELSRPHLVLANAGHVDSIGACDLGQSRQDFLRGHHAVFSLRPPHRVAVLQTVEVTPPSGDVIALVLLLHRDDFVNEHRKRVGEVTDDRNVRESVLRDLSGINVDVHDLRTRRERIEVAGHAVIEASTECDDQVGALQSTDGCHGSVHTRHTQGV